MPAVTLAQMAEALMARGVPAPRGGRRWSPAQLRRALLAAAAVAEAEGAAPP